MNKKSFTICEYQCISVHENSEYQKTDIGYAIPKHEFDAVESFILENDNLFLTISQKHGYGKVLQAQQYVGTIQTKKGLTIEILPKIGKTQSVDNVERKTIQESSRQILIKMLKHLKNSPFKEFNRANLRTQNMHLFDVYISMFCNEVEQLLKRGLRSDYIRNEDNLNFLKGKLLFKDNIRYNLTNKAKFFVSYDEYSQNRPENKLIKTTLEYLTNKTSNFSLQQHIRQLVFAMEEIKPSANIKADFNKCKCNRLMKDYSNIIMWCRLFLTNESFVSFKGSSIAFAILFDMNRVFEDYVAHCLRKNEQYKNNVINVQHSGHSLIEFPNSLFNLKPDIVIFEEDRVYEILDTKWKRIEEFKNISQSDIYQMYAYVTKYKEADKVSLVYPKISDSTGFKKKHCFNKDGEAKHLEIKFFDLDNNELVD